MPTQRFGCVEEPMGPSSNTISPEDCSCRARHRATGPVRPAMPSRFTTQDINRCQSTTRACALAYNRWNWHCRAANLTAPMVAITSRPLLLAALERATHSSWAYDAVPRAATRQDRPAQFADRQHPRGAEARQGCCGPMRGAAALLQPAHCATKPAEPVALRVFGYGVKLGLGCVAKDVAAADGPSARASRAGQGAQPTYRGWIGS